MAISKVTIAATPLFEDVALGLRTEVIQESEAKPVNVIIVLDRSGSMAGSQIEAAKTSICTFYQKILAQTLLASNTLIAFDSYAETFDFTGRSPDAVEREVKGIQAGGGTNFRDALAHLSNRLASVAEDSAFFVAFFSDGVDTSGLNGSHYRYPGIPHTEPQDVIQKLKADMEAKKAMCCIHTIGFGSGHDAVFLTGLTRAGTHEGTFHYVKSSADIITTMDTVKELMIASSFSPSMQIVAEDDKIIAILQMSIKSLPQEKASNDAQLNVQVLTGTGYITALPAPNTTLRARLGDEEFEAVIVAGATEESKVLMDTVDFVHTMIRELTGRVCKGSLERQELQEIEANTYTNLRQLVGNMDKVACARKAASVRKTLRGPIMEAAQLLNQFYVCALAPALTSTLTNEKIASLNALAYKHVTKSRLKSHLEKTAAANVAKLEEAEARMKVIVEHMDFDKLDQAEDVEQQGVCSVTLQNYVDALRDGDCMCLALDVSRPEAAIADPSRVIIKKILPTFMTAEAFLESVTFALEGAEGYNAQAGHEAVHGGFGANQNAQVVPGSANEAVTAVMPLFINRSHWSIAREKLKPVLGWVCTLNILGYSYQQVKTVPFLVLIKAVSDIMETNNEFHQRNLKLVLEVCTAIYKQGQGIKDEILNAEGQLVYLTGPQQRTLDAVPNTGVMLAHLLCAAKAGHLSAVKPAHWAQLSRAVLEEELRRRQPQPNITDSHAGSDAEAWEALGISTTRDIMPFIEPALNSDEPLPGQEKIQAELEQKVQHIDWSQLLKNEAVTASLKGLAKAIKHSDRILAVVQHVQQQAQHRATSFPSQAQLTFDGLPLVQKAALWLQNRKGYKNADRRACIEDGTYADPFEQPEAVLQREWIQLVQGEVQNRFSKLKDMASQLQADRRARAFERAQTVNDAAKAVQGAYIGKPDLHAMITTIQNPSKETTPELLRTKLQLLMQGEHGGERLFADKGPVTSWKPSRVNCCRYVRQNWQSIPCEEAIATFSHIPARVITEWYSRLQAGEGMGNGRQPGTVYQSKKRRRSS